MKTKQDAYTLTITGTQENKTITYDNFNLALKAFKNKVDVHLTMMNVFCKTNCIEKNELIDKDKEYATFEICETNEKIKESDRFHTTIILQKKNK